MISLTELLAHLPPEPDEAPLLAEIQQIIAESRGSGPGALHKRKLVVIDDDPTGTQTLHDIDLLLSWDQDQLARALRSESYVLYILTNSRSMPQDDAVRVNRELAQQLAAASQAAGVDFVVASRSDSTLRGHYPAEVVALVEALRAPGDQSPVSHLLIPAFFEGGRYTIGDIHYVAGSGVEADQLRPAHETPFAQDSVFGYSTSYLPAWIEQKSHGRWRAGQVVSIGLEQIRLGGPTAVAETLKAVGEDTPVIINAAGYGDLAIVVLGLLRAEAIGKRFVYRTAASFVRLRGGLATRPLLTAEQIMQAEPATTAGGLVVVGSYVPGSSRQLEKLLAHADITGIELPVERVIRSDAEARAVSLAASKQIEAALQAGHTSVLYTSRKLITGTDHSQSLDIGKKVSTALIEAVRGVTSRPRFIIAKGGITSHNIAQYGLGAATGRVLGQLIPGVPVWTLQTGSRFEGIPYIVFPGNVGNDESLQQAVHLLSDKQD